MYKATEEIVKELDTQNIIYYLDHYTDDNQISYDCVHIKFSTENISSLLIELLIDENSFISLRSFIANNIDNKYYISALKHINSINQTYSYVKFFIDEDMDLCVQADCPLLPEDLDYAIRVVGFVSLYIDILNEAYPKIIKY